MNTCTINLEYGDHIGAPIKKNTLNKQYQYVQHRQYCKKTVSFI